MIDNIKRRYQRIHKRLPDLVQDKISIRPAQESLSLKIDPSRHGAGDV